MKGARAGLSSTAIVDAARALVVADGVDALSLRRLATRLGVTAPALYLHFDSKDALLTALAETEFAALIAGLDAAAVEAGADPLAVIRAQSRAYVEHALAHPAGFELLLRYRPAWATSDGGTELPLASKAWDAGAVAVADAVRAGALREPDPLLAALTIWSAVHGVATLLAAGPRLGADYERALVDSVLDAVVTGLAQRGR